MTARVAKGANVANWKSHGKFAFLLLFLIAGCSGPRRAYHAPSGTILKMQVLSAEAVSSQGAKVSVCYELPSDADWVLGRLLGDVALSDGNGSAPMSNLEELALSASTSKTPSIRCDRLFFSRPGGFPRGNYSLLVERLAASLPPQTDWPALQSALDKAGTGIIVTPLPDDGRSFALVERPQSMTDQQASLIVTGMMEPVVIGPWVIPVTLGQ